MKDENNKARLLTVGIAALLIVIICGISFVVRAFGHREKEDSSSKLQAEILEYANSTQGKEDVQEPGAKEIKEETLKDDTQTASGEKNEKEAGTETVAADAATAATTTEDVKPNSQEVVVAEQAPPAQQPVENKNTTGASAKWQRDVSENLAQVEIDLSRQMSEMKGYWEAGNMEAVEDLAYLPRYRAASQKLEGTTKYYYYGDTDSNNRPSGMGLASYADNQYYYGEWADGVRSGNGMWIKYYVYGQNAKAEESLYMQHSYSGSWAGDLPDGEGSEHYDLIQENLEPNAGYNSNFIGTFKKGLYNGEMYITNLYGNGNTKEWSGTARNGVWMALGQKDKKGQYPVIFEITNPDNYQWMSEKKNKNQGVDGLISAALK